MCKVDSALLNYVSIHSAKERSDRRQIYHLLRIKEACKRVQESQAYWLVKVVDANSAIFIQHGANCSLLQKGDQALITNMAINDADHFLSGNTSIMSMVLNEMHKNNQFDPTFGKHIPAVEEAICFMADPIDLPEWWVDLNGLHHTGKSTGKPYHGITGQYLDERPVNLARQEEIKHGIRRYKVYDKVPIDECIRHTRRQPELGG